MIGTLMKIVSNGALDAKEKTFERKNAADIQKKHDVYDLQFVAAARSKL
jgi:hypothetical protein